MKRFFVLLLIVKVNTLFEGDKCTVPQTKKDGRCLDIEYCDYAKAALKQGKNPEVCGFNGNIPLVCCPSPPGALSHAMCSKYFNKKYAIYAIELGEKALSKEFPHMAAVGYGEEKTNILWLCGGTLISHYYILSAAHCAEALEYGPATWIRLGDLDLKNTTEDANPLDLRIVDVLLHPDYKPSSHYHDIALFKVKEKAFFGLYFKPACLHLAKEFSVNSLQATGWGKMGTFGDPSSHLMKADLKIIPFATCRKKYENISRRKLKDGIKDEIQMCAGDEAGRDTCPGDSGGPLHYMNMFEKPVRTVQHFTIAGVTSFGKGCGGMNSAGVYTRVSSYVEWIENIVWPED